MATMTKTLFTTTTLARLAGVHRNTVQNYAKRGVLAPTVLSDGTRAYGPDDVDRVRIAMADRKRKPTEGGSR